jgi:IS605 OrfB family transposase
VSGRAIRAEHRMHLADTKARAQAVARRAPKPGQKGSRRWRHYRRRQRLAEARHGRRVRQAQHEAAKTVIGWAVTCRVGTLAVGDPRGVLNLDAGRRHNERTRDWRIGRLIATLKDKAEAAGIDLQLVDERGTPRRRAHHRDARGSPGRHRPAPASPMRLARESLANWRGAWIPHGVTGKCTSSHPISASAGYWT